MRPIVRKSSPIRTLATGVLALTMALSALPLAARAEDDLLLDVEPVELEGEAGGAGAEIADIDVEAPATDAPATGSAAEPTADAPATDPATNPTTEPELYVDSDVASQNVTAQAEPEADLSAEPELLVENAASDQELVVVEDEASEPQPTPSAPAPGAPEATMEAQAATKPSVAYYVHRQKYGWEKAYSKKDGDQSGTTGQSKRLEGIHIKLASKPVSGGITYRTHIQTYGWEKTWKSDGKMSGTTGESKRLEAIQIKLTGQMAKKFDVWYRVHAQRFGWMGWAKNGASAGTAGFSYRLESIQIVITPKGAGAPATTLKGAKRNSTAAFEKCGGTSSTDLVYTATENGNKLTVNVATKRTWTIVKARYGYNTDGVIDLSSNSLSFFIDHHLVEPKGVGTGWVDAKGYTNWDTTYRWTYDVTRTLASAAERARTGCKYKYTQREATYKLQLLYKNGKLIGYRYALTSSPNIKVVGSEAGYPEPYYSNHKFSARQMCTLFPSWGIVEERNCQTAADKAYARNYNSNNATWYKYDKDIYYLARGGLWTIAEPHIRLG